MKLYAIVLGYLLGNYRALRVFPWLAAWARHGYARALGGTWFMERQACPGCQRRVHVLVRREEVLHAEVPGDHGWRCFSCARGWRR